MAARLTILRCISPCVDSRSAGPLTHTSEWTRRILAVTTMLAGLVTEGFALPGGATSVTSSFRSRALPPSKGSA